MTDVASVGELTRRVVDAAERVIVGKRVQIETVVAGVLARGHVLLEDVPGTGKTMLARALAAAIGTDFRRIQCTPDLLPNDVTGVSVYDTSTGSFRFRPGPVFAGVVLADEINRATPRTQAALLEAMAERQVTVDGESHRLPEPFFVVATQNPIEYEGTFPLPEAQLDRFLLSLDLGYPDRETETELVRTRGVRPPIDLVEPVATVDELLTAMDVVESVHLAPEIADLIVELVTATRTSPLVDLGASPRAGLGLAAVSRAWAAMQARDFVTPDDVKTLAIPVLSHRLVLAADARLRRMTPVMLIEALLEGTPIDVEPE